MKITYKNKTIERLCTNAHAAERKLGVQMAEKLHQRIDEIAAADTVEKLHQRIDEIAAADTVEMMVQYRIGRCHLLKQDRKGQYAVDLVHPYRLIFEKCGEEIEVANIVEIVDYH